MKGILRIAIGGILALVISTHAFAEQSNIILFVFDGLRAAAVDDETTPTMARFKADGVNFRNTHSLFPTVTTANGSAIATGHYLGDTGDFGNTIYSGFPIASIGGTYAPFIQHNGVLKELNRHLGGNFLNEQSMMAAARARGYITAVLGKVGPVGIQDITTLDGASTIFFDDQTGTRDGIPVAAGIATALKEAGLPASPPERGAPKPGEPAMTQQDYYRNVVTKVLLPRAKAANKPFFLIYWSPEPDTAQHGQQDSIGRLTPGINGPTSVAAIKAADAAAGAILAKVNELGLSGSTNIFMTADHGFSVVSKESKTSPSTKYTYPGTVAGFLPPGFVAIDLAEALGLTVFEPVATAKPIDYKTGGYPRSANAALGSEPGKPQVVIAANGGSDLIYLPDANAKELAPKIVKALMAQDYVSGIFVDDALGAIPGTLPLGTIRLKGSARTPHPAIAVNFRSFTTGCGRPLYCSAIIADTALKHGQGHHGSLSRADTANFMAAGGPAFKRTYRSLAPISNADIAPTIAHILGLKLPSNGKLQGRVITEALKGGRPVQVTARTLVSARGDNGLRTVLNLKYVGTTAYFDSAGFPSRTLGLTGPNY